MLFFRLLRYALTYSLYFCYLIIIYTENVWVMHGNAGKSSGENGSVKTTTDWLQMCV